MQDIVPSISACGRAHKAGCTCLMTQYLELPVVHAGRPATVAAYWLRLLPLLLLLRLPPLPLLKQQQLRDSQQDVPAVCCGRCQQDPLDIAILADSCTDDEVEQAGLVTYDC